MENHEPAYFDLIMVYTSHRRHCNYLTISKYLSPYRSIGILRFEPKHEWGATEEAFWQMCLQVGAKPVRGKARCHTLLIPRFGKGKTRGYYEDILEDMPAQISYSQLFYNIDGIPSGFQAKFSDDICNKLGKPVLLVPSLKFFGLVDAGTHEVVEKNGLQTIEVGSPYAKYPIFEEFSTDYLLAYPSHVSVQSHWETYALLRNIVAVLKKLPPKDKVVVKPHNVRDTGNRVSITSNLFNRLPFWMLRFALTILHTLEFRWNKQSLYRFLPDKVLNRFVLLHNTYIFKKCENLLDTYPAFNLEFFARGIQKGLITGLSQSIIEALLHKVPVCICDDSPLEGKSRNYRLIIEAFGLSKRLEFSTDGIDKIDESMRNADLIEFLKNTVTSTPENFRTDPLEAGR